MGDEGEESNFFRDRLSFGITLFVRILQRTAGKMASVAASPSIPEGVA